MKCPKCNYLSFEPEPRCRNCGYELSLTDVDLPAQPLPGHDAQLVDHDLKSLDMPGEKTLLRRGGPTPSRTPDGGIFDPVLEVLDREIVTGSTAMSAPVAAPAPPVEAPPAGVKRPPVTPRRGTMNPRAARPVEPARQPVPRPSVHSAAPSAEVVAWPAQAAPVSKTKTSPASAQPTSTVELPLFVHGLADREEPLVKVPAAPRAPLGVRRKTPDPAKIRTRTEMVSSASRSPDAPNRSAPTPPLWDPREEPGPEQLPPAWREPVFAKRVAAALVDLVLLGGINVAVVWLTLYACGLDRRDLGSLPMLPLLGFFVILDGGYLILLTAACGQTLGKMATGIRVVGTSAEAIINDRVTLGQAATRAVAELFSVLPLGLGLWLGYQGRTWHDNIAHTRVVRV